MVKILPIEEGKYTLTRLHSHSSKPLKQAYFAWSARAIRPDAMAVAAEVAPKSVTHPD